MKNFMRCRDGKCAYKDTCKRWLLRNVNAATETMATSLRSLHNDVPDYDECAFYVEEIYGNQTDI